LPRIRFLRAEKQIFLTSLFACLVFGCGTVDFGISRGESPPSQIFLEGEDGRGDGKVMCRSDASAENTVWLLDGESRNFSIRLPADARYSLSLRYSNDHDLTKSLETVRVSVDDLGTVGEFTAQNTRLPDKPLGTGWNIFRWSGNVSTLDLGPGRHEVTVSISGGDGNGVEIDRVKLERVD